MCRSMVDIQSATAEIRRGKKEEGRRNHRTKIYCPHLLQYFLFGGRLYNGSPYAIVYRYPVCPVCLSVCLSLCDVGVLWPNVGWIKMKLGTEVGLDPGHIVLDRTQLPLPKRGTAPQFSAHVCCSQMVAHLNYTAEDLLVLLKTMEVSYDCLQNKLVISPLRTHSTIRNEAYGLY